MTKLTSSELITKYGKFGRRNFLKGALAVGGALALAGCGNKVVEPNTVINTVTNTVTANNTVTATEPVAEAPAAKYTVKMPCVILPDYTQCTGCRYCIAACTDKHYQEYCLNKSNIQVYSIHTHGGVVDIPMLCMHCNNAPCVEVCPDKVAAITINKATGARIIDHDKCTLCGRCVDACADRGVGCLRVSNEEDMVVGMCDMCGGTPECMAICPEDLFNFALLTTDFNSNFVYKPQEIAERVGEIIFTV